MQTVLLYLTGIVVAGVAAQWLAWRLKLPAILLLLVFGFGVGRLARPEQFLQAEVLFPLVSLAVALILFEGGLSLRLSDLQQTGRTVLRLVTVGVLITWGLTAAAAHLLFDLDLRLAVLLGALFTVTGPTVVVPLLHQIRPFRRVGSIAKWEGIVNDPVGAVLAVLVFEAVLAGGPEAAARRMFQSLGLTVVASVAIGFCAAFLFVVLLRRHWVPDYLENPLLLALVLAAFTASNLVQPESGLVTVTLLGVILANQKTVTIGHLVEFKENLRVLLISVLFIVLASRLEPADITGTGLQGLAFLAVMILVVRPVSVFAATFGSPLTWRERTFLAWLAPRGIVAAAVASVFALELTHAAGANAAAPAVVEQAGLLVPITFLVIVGTVAVYGLTASPLARRLQVAEPDPQGLVFVGADPVARELAGVLQEQEIRVLLVDTNYFHIREARMAGLPTFHGSALSESVLEDLDLGGLGKLLAMTPNNEINSLAALQFADIFGRSNVFQLPRPAPGENRRNEVAGELKGRTLFDPRADYHYLARRLGTGAVLKATPLSKEFDAAAFHSHYGDSALSLFVIGSSGKLRISTTEQPVEPQAGEMLIALVDPPQEDREPAAETDA